MAEKDYSNLRDSEILSMPFWKRLCYAAFPWNHSFDPQSVDEWDQRFGVFGAASADLIKKAVRLHEEYNGNRVN